MSAATPRRARRSEPLTAAQLARRAEIAEERRSRTRLKLVQATCRLSAARGFDAPTVAEIVAEAGLGHGTFYTHFESRDALFAAVAMEMSDEIHRAIVPRLQRLDDPAQQISLAMRVFLRFAIEDEARGWILLRTLPLAGTLSVQIEKAHRRLVGDGVRLGRFTVISIDGAVSVGLGNLLMTIRRLLLASTDREAIIAEAATIQLCTLGIAEAEARDIAARLVDRDGS